MPAFFIYNAIMYPHVSIAITIITNTNLCFVLNVILSPRFLPTSC